MKKIFLFLTLILFGFFGFSQSRYIPKTTKKIVFSRDGGVCQCCGSSEKIEYDHITPFSCGGSNEVSNIQLLCLKCNRSKSNSCYCKVHEKNIGTNCCNGEVNKYNTSSTAAQCTGTTKKGNRCKKKTTNSNGRCNNH